MQKFSFAHVLQSEGHATHFPSLRKVPSSQTWQTGVLVVLSNVQLLQPGKLAEQAVQVFVRPSKYCPAPQALQLPEESTRRPPSHAVQVTTSLALTVHAAQFEGVHG